jgi:hypothetical protein
MAAATAIAIALRRAAILALLIDLRMALLPKFTSLGLASVRYGECGIFTYGGFKQQQKLMQNLCKRKITMFLNGCQKRAIYLQ